MPSTTQSPAARAAPAIRSSDAERTVLGAVLLDPEKLIDVSVELSPEDFADPVYAAVYRALLGLFNDRKPVDFLTVAEALAGNQQIERLGGSGFLAELAQDVPTASHAGHYAAIVREKARKRRLEALGNTVARLATDPDTAADDALDRLERELLALSRSSAGAKPQSIAEAAAESFERYAALYEAEDKAALLGVTTGFPALDRMLVGLPAGHLMILAARPSMGKTSLALNIARNVASQGKRVTIFSLEMTRRQIMDRIIAAYLGVATWKVQKAELSEEQFTRMGTLIDQLKGLKLHIDDDPDATLVNLRSKARRQQLECGVDLLVIDYLQLIEVTDRLANENATQRTSYISRNLKNLARELQCPVVALSQLSRSPESRNPPIPILSDLRDSGAIEQDADSVLMLYRQGYYDEDCPSPEVTDVYVRKNRNGPTGRVELRFDAERMTFESVG